MLMGDDPGPSVILLYGEEEPAIGAHLFVSSDGSYTAKGNKINHYHQGRLGEWDGETGRVYYGVVVKSQYGGKPNHYVVAYQHVGVALAENLWQNDELFPNDIVGLSVGVGINGPMLISWVGEEPNQTGVNGGFVPELQYVFKVAEYTAPESRKINLVL
jgi:hypothetical protein